MITPEDLPHFVTGQHDRFSSLAFLRSNNSILTCLFLLSLFLKNCLEFWLYFGFYIKWQECFFRYRSLYDLIRKKKFKPKATRDVAKHSALFGGYIRKAFLADFQKLPEIFKTYSARIFIIIFRTEKFRYNNALLFKCSPIQLFTEQE